MTEYEKGKALQKRTPPIRKIDMTAINNLFAHYLFRRSRTREIWTSCCHRHGVLEEGNAHHETLMWARHETEERSSGSVCCHMGYMSRPPEPQRLLNRCPFCGATVTVKELGRTGRRDNLLQYQRVVVLRQYRGALWASAYCAYKNYGGECGLTAMPGMSLQCVYRFQPGCAERVGRYGFMTRMVGRPKKLPLPIGAPFSHSSEDGMGYYLVGREELGKSDFRYCQVERYFGGETVPFATGIMQLLAVATVYPRQMEMLTKVGLKDVVEDLAWRKRWNARAFRWDAANPLTAFGLSREELREFLGKQYSVELLGYYKQLQKHKLPCTFEELEALRRELHGIIFTQVVARLTLCKVRVGRFLSYLSQENGQKGQKKKTTQELAIDWKDYIDAAQVLGYDLKNQVMALPKQLCRKHDAATVAATPLIIAKKTKERSEAEKALQRKLAKRYVFRAGDWLIRPPTGMDEIVAEGKALKHCVGGYAQRHLEGKLVILFLREVTHPGIPLATIEMNGDALVQIQAWNNGRIGKTPVREYFAELLAQFLAWTAKGSKRDKNGHPKVKIKQEESQVA